MYGQATTRRWVGLSAGDALALRPAANADRAPACASPSSGRNAPCMPAGTPRTCLCMICCYEACTKYLTEATDFIANTGSERHLTVRLGGACATSAGPGRPRHLRRQGYRLAEGRQPRQPTEGLGKAARVPSSYP